MLLDTISGDYPGILLHLAEVMLHRRGDRRGGSGIIMLIAPIDDPGVNPVNIPGMIIMLIITILLLYI
jgi:hypothetical protein